MEYEILYYALCGLLGLDKDSACEDLIDVLKRKEEFTEMLCSEIYRLNKIIGDNRAAQFPKSEVKEEDRCDS